MPLSDYGTPIRSYEGIGTLHLQSGTRVPCSFEAGQLPNGDVLVLSGTPADVWESDAADRLTGQTSGGWSVDAELDLPMSVLGREPDLPAGTYFAHRVVNLRASVPGAATVATHRYSLVNFAFSGRTRSLCATQVAFRFDTDGISSFDSPICGTDHRPYRTAPRVQPRGHRDCHDPRHRSNV